MGNGVVAGIAGSDLGAGREGYGSADDQLQEFYPTAQLQEVQVTAKKIDVKPDAIFDVGDMVLPDEWRNIEAKAPSLTVGVTAQSGDSISKILGTSNPKAVEAFMRANNLSGSTIQAGREYVMPSSADFEASDGRVGQAVLNADNRRLADAAAVPGTFSGDMRLAQANGVSMDEISTARAYSMSGAASSGDTSVAPAEAQAASYGSASWSEGLYLAGPIPKASYNLGDLSLTVNGTLNAVNSVVNGAANFVGAATEPFDRYQGEMISVETGLGPGAGLAMAPTLLLGRISSEIRAASAINAELGLTKSAGQIGREGEVLASQITGATKNTESWVVNGRTRIPDQVLAQDIATRNPLDIVEVKNVQYQAFTRQLRDYADLVGPGGGVNVLLPPEARVSGPLQRAFDNPFSPLNRMDLVGPR